MGWAAHKITDSGTGKGGVKGERFDFGTCLASLLACDSKSVEFEDPDNDIGRLEDTGCDTRGS